MARTYFLTGALGCIGAWVIKTLVERGDRAVAFDASDDDRRVRDLVEPDALAGYSLIRGDLTDRAAVTQALRASAAQSVIHLAALQVPFCKADPAKGAAVNVLGTVHVFESVKAVGLRQVVYASSAAVYGPGAEVPDETALCEPTTHYGVYKRANEGTAGIYAQDDGIASVGLRPLTVYGVGRDQGLTSGPTTAMKAAVLGDPYRIGFSGATDFLFAGDAAAAFVLAADIPAEGARVFNLHGDTAEVLDVIDMIDSLTDDARSGRITAEGPEIPIPPMLDGAAVRLALPGLPATPLAEGIGATMQRFRELKSKGRLDTRDLPSESPTP
jgi:nucleoside-diphosphate-sugar epimerase